MTRAGRGTWRRQKEIGEHSLQGACSSAQGPCKGRGEQRMGGRCIAGIAPNRRARNRRRRAAAPALGPTCQGAEQEGDGPHPGVLRSSCVRGGGCLAATKRDAVGRVARSGALARGREGRTRDCARSGASGRSGGCGANGSAAHLKSSCRRRCARSAAAWGAHEQAPSPAIQASHERRTYEAGERGSQRPGPTVGQAAALRAAGRAEPECGSRTLGTWAPRARSCKACQPIKAQT